MDSKYFYLGTREKRISTELIYQGSSYWRKKKKKDKGS